MKPEQLRITHTHIYKYGKFVIQIVLVTDFKYPSGHNCNFYSYFKIFLLQQDIGEILLHTSTPPFKSIECGLESELNAAVKWITQFNDENTTDLRTVP